MKKNKKRSKQYLSTGIGGVFCPICGYFFDDSKLTRANFHSCKQHDGLKGYHL